MNKILILMLLIPLPLFSLDISARINPGFDVQSINSNSQLYPLNLLQKAGITNEGFDYYVNSDVILKSAIGDIGKAYLDIRYTYYPKTFITNALVQYFNIVESYADVDNQYFLFRLGKHFMHWGDGAVFNPVDIVDLRKDPLSYTGFDQGKPGADLTIPIGDFSSFSALSLVDSTLTTNIDDLPAIFQYFLSIDMFDGFVFADFQKNYKPEYGGNVDYVWSIKNNISLKLYSQMTYKEDSYRKFAAGTNGVYYLENMTNNYYIAGAVGLSLSFSFTETPLIDGIIFQAEYYYNDESWGKNNYQNFLSYINKLTNNNNVLAYENAIIEEESLKNSKNYFYTGVTIVGLIDKDFSLSYNMILNIDDQSFVMIPNISYQINLNTTVSLSSQFYCGSSTSKFGSLSQLYSVNANLSVSF